LQESIEDKYLKSLLPIGLNRWRPAVPSDGEHVFVTPADWSAAGIPCFGFIAMAGDNNLMFDIPFVSKA